MTPYLRWFNSLNNFFDMLNGTENTRFEKYQGLLVWYGATVQGDGLANEIEYRGEIAKHK